MAKDAVAAACLGFVKTATRSPDVSLLPPFQ
jgi:hypothetical protein